MSMPVERVKPGPSQESVWDYPRPPRLELTRYETIHNYIAFYPQFVDHCLVDGQVATPMPGGFYGGWITRDVVGPFKGAPGTLGW